LISICETISLEESHLGVTATALAPGYVDTDMSNWKHGEISPAEMLQVEDIAEIAIALTRLSATAVVPNVVISRAG
jgi:NAD(P)-dependent dehydrogenase (short-subunit alcohol dehydrogenase family)